MELSFLDVDALALGTPSPDAESPWDESDHRYFSPSPGDSPSKMVAQLATIVPELSGLRLERPGPGLVVLRAGALRSPVQGGAISAASLAIAINRLLHRAQVPERFVELRWPGAASAYAFASMDDTLELLNDGQLACADLGELMELTAW